MKPTLVFRSKLGPTIIRNLELNFALGRRYECPIKALKSLDRFVNRLPRSAQDLTTEIFDSWCQSMSALTARTR